ncbi:MAG TPA: thioredoxin family protein [Prolixibacteraceae bacterium]|nr:thioredoxin family protein [Prolixibacteraceae bacterium]
MKRILFLIIMVLPVIAMATGNSSKLPMGGKAMLTEIKMNDISGAEISLADAKKENGLLVLFSSNACPFVLQWEGRYNDLKAWADKNKVGMVVLNSNHQKRDSDDSFESMKKHAAEMGYKFNYVLDNESLIANAFGGQTTPHAFLFNSKMELVYKGAIDDSYKSAADVKEPYVKNAIAEIAAGKPVSVAETKPVGCSIKRKVE